MERGSRLSVHSNSTEEDDLPSLSDSLRVIRQRLWVVLVVAIALVGVSVGFSLSQTPQYEASIKILVGQEQDTVDPNNLAGNVQGLQQLTQTLAEAVNSRPLVEAVIQEQNLNVTPEDFLKNKMSVEQIPDTQFIRVSYEDPDPVRARQVVNAIGEVFSERVSEISPEASAVKATVWDPATAPVAPASPNPVRDGVLALVLGIFIGAGLAFLLDYLDDSWRSPEEAEQVSGKPTFAVIPEFRVEPRVSKATKGEKQERKHKHPDGPSFTEKAGTKGDG